MRPNCLGAARLPLLVAAIVWLATGSAAAADGSIKVTLESQHKSGVSGQATFKSQGDSTVVTVSVSGGGGGQFLPDVRSGTCAHAAASPEIPLAMTSGDAPSETTIDISLADLSDGSYVIVLHRLNGELTSLSAKTSLACGAIGTKQEIAPIANSAPVTGVGPTGTGSGVGDLIVSLAGIAAGGVVIAWRIQKRSMEL